jgi:thiol:disulfide interchange protein
MALPMGLTALALVWLASRVGGNDFAIVCAVGAVGLIGILYAAGKKQRAGEQLGPQLLVGLLILALGMSYAMWRMPPQRGVTEFPSILQTRPFSEQALITARASGKPVFVYFTADWCLTCKVNERVAIEREATRDAFAKAGVTVLRGDWTRRDPAITRFLAQHGAAGVPLYLWYPAGSAAPVQLPQLLGPDALAELAKAARTN